jgi:glutathione synthase/RimK-type ligase-like ATP-grasp enzyme
MPGDDVLAIQYLDASGADGLARKYRAMFIDGKFYPVHMAASRDWKVHYVTSDMANRPDLRAEEEKFLAAMPEVLGPRAMAALERIRDTLALDYGGVDFAVARDGRLLLFEANATMTILPPGPDPKWDYRRAAIARVLDAARQLVRDRAVPR